MAVLQPIHLEIQRFVSHRKKFMQNFIQANWPAASTIKAFSTTRQGGFSLAPYESFNLGDHCGDNMEKVQRNRQLLNVALGLPHDPIWLSQIHGTHAVVSEHAVIGTKADAAYTMQKNTVCAVLTADCLPVLVCDRAATRVAAIHAGWKGLVSGVIEATIKHLDISSDELLVWLGPAISQQAYEVGDEVRTQFMDHDANAALAFIPSPNKRWLANMYLLAKQRLTALGITNIYGGDFCTYSQPELFFSYRRDNVTGRMASLIWIDQS